MKQMGFDEWGGAAGFGRALTSGSPAKEIVNLVGSLKCHKKAAAKESTRQSFCGELVELEFVWCLCGWRWWGPRPKAAPVICIYPVYSVYSV